MTMKWFPWVAILLAILLGLAIKSQADETWYSNTSVDGSGDDGSIEAPYDTLAQAVAAKAGSLTGRGVVTLSLAGSAADTAVANMSGWTDGTATDHVRIVCSDPHSGVWTELKYRLAPTTNYSSALTNLPAYTEVVGLQFSETGTSSSCLQWSADGITVVNCLFRQPTNYGVVIGGSSCRVQSCVFLGGGRAISVGTSKSNVVILHCTGANQATYGIYVNEYSTVTAKNCYFGGSGTADYFTTANGTLNLTNCYSEDGTKSTTTAACATDSGAYFTSVTPGSEDIHIGESSALVDVGADTSGDMDPDEDVDGETIPMGSAPDIGADELTGEVGLANNPSPANSATGQARAVILSWTAGTGAVSHNVYFGTDSTPDETELVEEEYGETSFDPDGLLDHEKTYYWRIDEVQGDESVVTGDVWSFTTLEVHTYYASPAGSGDGSDAEHPKAWGDGDWMAAGDTVYLLSGNYGAWESAVDGIASEVITISSVAPFGAVFTEIAIDHDYYTLSGVDVTSASSTLGQDSILWVTDDATGVTITDSKIHGVFDGTYIDVVQYLVRLEGPGYTVEDCEMYHGNDGVQLWDAGVVRRCYIHETYSSAVKLTYPGATLEYCRVGNNRPSYEEPPANPEDVAHASGLSLQGNGWTVRGCLLYNYGTTRLARMYQGNVYTGITFENNICIGTQTYDLDESGLNLYCEFWGVGEDCTFRNNTFDCFVRMGLGDPNDEDYTIGDGVVIANNLITGTLEMVGDYDGGKWRVNSVATNAAQITAAVANGMVEAENRVYALTVAGDAYATPKDFSDFWSSPTSTEHADSAYWAEGTLFDCKTGSTPFTLESDAVAVDEGSAVYGSTTDFFGNDRDASPDIGAMEYGAGTPPSQASTPAPADDVPLADPTPTLSWAAVEGASRYDVYVSDNSTIDSSDYQSDTWPGLVAFDSNSAAVSDMVGIGGTLTDGLTYYWRVDVIDVNDGCTKGPVWSFTYYDEAPTATLISPADEATGELTNVTLYWSNDSPIAEYYDVYMGMNSVLVAAKDASVKVATQQETQWYAAGLSNSTTYYWLVVSKDAGGANTADSEMWSFTTGAAAGPSAATSLLPADGSTSRSRNVTLSWTAGAGCTTYDVYLGTSRVLGSGDIVSNDQAGVTYSATALTRGTTYYWRIVGSDGANDSPPAESAFTIKAYTVLVTP